MKKHLSNIMLVFVFVAGLSLLLYPTFSDWWNSQHQSRAIAGYSSTVQEIDKTQYEGMWADAREYNDWVKTKTNRFYMDAQERAWYDSLLNVSGNGIIGYLDVPRLGSRMAMYHGTAEAVLQIGIGHMEGSSLPTGDVGTHCVLSGHRGLPSARLFTDLDLMELGDQFMLHVLGETLTYEVDQILVVLPENVKELQIDQEKDYCTLVTCTPYGINSHRLLVRGHRVENAVIKAAVYVTSDAVLVDEWTVVPFVSAPIVVLLVLYVMIKPGKR